MSQKDKEIWKTRNDVFDAFTHRNLFLLEGRGHFDQILSPIALGKEANIFTAKKGPENLILKIYRVATCDFFGMYSYIRDDPRYFSLKNQRRQVIFAWAQREYRNLHLARTAGVSVPTPYHYKDNIVIMEMIGTHQPALKLKAQEPKNKRKFLSLVLKNMQLLHQGGLAHGDLSEFNILNFDEKPVFIDFSQASPLTSSRAQELLERDCTNIARYFTKIGASTTKQEVLNFVTQKESKDKKEHSSKKKYTKP